MINAILYILFRSMSNYLRLRNFPKIQGQAPTVETEICFVNASLQLMNSLPECRRYFVEKQYKTQDSQQRFPICDDVSAIFRTPNTISNGAGSLRQLIASINGWGYLGVGQQDMTQFLTILLDEIDKEITRFSGQILLIN